MNDGRTTNSNLGPGILVSGLFLRGYNLRQPDIFGSQRIVVLCHLAAAGLVALEVIRCFGIQVLSRRNSYDEWCWDQLGTQSACHRRGSMYWRRAGPPIVLSGPG